MSIYLIFLQFLSGLTSLILLLIGLINGTAALWSYEFSKLAKIRPVFTKLFHNLIGIAAFIIGKPYNTQNIVKLQEINLEIETRLLYPVLVRVPLYQPNRVKSHPNVVHSQLSSREWQTVLFASGIVETWEKEWFSVFPMEFGFDKSNYRFIAKLLCVGGLVHIGGHAISLRWDWNTFVENADLERQNA